MLVLILITRTVVRFLPTLLKVLLVKVTSYNNSRRYSVQHGENADPDHQLLEFISLSPALLFNHVPDPEEGHEPGEEEREPE